jgi:hypothetical protein
VQERIGSLEKAVGPFERSKALKGKAQECWQAKNTARGKLARSAEWVKKPRVRYFLEGRQLPRRMFEERAKKRADMS